MSFFRTVASTNQTTEVNKTPVEDNGANEISIGHLNTQDLCAIIQANDLKLQKEGVETPNGFPIYDFTGSEDISESIDNPYLYDPFSCFQTTPNSNYADETPAEPEDNLDNVRTIECVVTNSVPVVTNFAPVVSQVAPDSDITISSFNPKRLCLNTPTINSLKKTSTALVSKDDGIALTGVEKENLRKFDLTPFTPEELANIEKIKIKKYFVKNEVLTEAVTNNNWWYEQIWVHAKPERGYMVYVDPKDYPNLKKGKGRTYHYGEPSIEVVRYGYYRKMYDDNNELKPKVKRKRGGRDKDNAGAKQAKPTESISTNEGMSVYNNQPRFAIPATFFNNNNNTTSGPSQPNTRQHPGESPTRWF